MVPLTAKAWRETLWEASDVCLTPEVDATYRPDANEQTMLLERYAMFRSLYRNT